MKKFLKLTATTTAALVLVAFLGYSAVEPTLLSAQSSDTDNVVVTLSVDEEISITDGANVTMSPNIGVTNDTSTGGSTWTVTTNAVSGYTLAVKATSSPAMQHSNGTDSFADYTEATPGTPDAWSVDSGNYEFGFSAYGDDVADGTYGSGSDCDNAGDPSGNSLNYEGLETTDQDIASNASTTPTTGTDTTICFGAGQNSVFAPSGTYTATVVATATTN